MWPRLIPLLLVLPLNAAPSDEELLKLVKERASSLERVTPKPVDMAPLVAADCAPERHKIDPKGRLNPHGAATFHVYTNDSATLPIFDPWGKFPEGSFVLKEKFNREDGKTTLFTGMVKREKGFYPEVQDWEFFTVDAEASKIVERGKLPSCAACHVEEKKTGLSQDYIMPAQLRGGRIVLHSSKAQVLAKKLHYEEKEAKNTLGFWVDADDKAFWFFDVDKPGTFEVHVWQGCGKGSGGSEVIVECAGQTTTFTVEETGGFQDFKERTVGKVTFAEAGRQKLEVRAKTKPGAAVMDLRQVVLVPVAK